MEFLISELFKDNDIAEVISAFVSCLWGWGGGSVVFQGRNPHAVAINECFAVPRNVLAP